MSYGNMVQQKEKSVLPTVYLHAKTLAVLRKKCS